uniref:Immunoglobulin C1-set domain-containing protein n=1 Tax=Sinocyclocheilus anshuiensis TaxID=1608454 RepID=A0A671M997_9TELE
SLATPKKTSWLCHWPRVNLSKEFDIMHIIFLFTAEKHSLYYIYTALSKPVNQPGIYQFTAMGLLDDRQIDYYNSDGHRKIPKQQWMKEKMQEDYWEKGTQSRKNVHVLQWRHGCEIEKQGSEVKFSKGIDEYSYDGENFLSFDDKESQWVAPVDAAVPTKKKWDNVPILNRAVSKCTVFVFVDDLHKLKLTCLATGFYPKDVTLAIRKYRTSLPEDEIESSGVKPNHDETFQLRKSVVIKEDEKAEYDCFVFHRTLKEPIIITWGSSSHCTVPATILPASLHLPVLTRSSSQASGSSLLQEQQAKFVYHYLAGLNGQVHF